MCSSAENRKDDVADVYYNWPEPRFPCYFRSDEKGNADHTCAVYQESHNRADLAQDI
jgi:hypothetical protein